MHNYAVLGHSRVGTGRWLNIMAMILTAAITSAITLLANLTDIAAIAGLPVTVGIVFGLLHLAFNKWGWKLLTFAQYYPDVKGTWIAKGQTLSEDGSTKYNWDAELIIQQEYETLSVTLKTNQSESTSDTGSITKLPSQNGWRLSYGYQNTPRSEQSHELNSHRGFCEITFDRELQSAQAQYFNNNGRRTHGIMHLERK